MTCGPRTQQLLPGERGRDDLLRVQPPGRALVRHLQKQQVGQLLGVLDDTDAVVAELTTSATAELSAFRSGR